ncbi:metallophosphoesterase family protein [Promicromonospora thailandica]|uniref:Calcineurin-like phosphoesterase n=1 Tax=Promicromonospora thailandica TaxID=765201 RepID=A0A9X2G1H1_9MICO|nr:metallophosphoesterase family protein [Promicromonospora thailandica]MCP2265094.1 Calcineurin-like phosphoesterase [Promicromonospora thailandica]BFF19841.1 metallophosphoesterase [Promicromonospora thailandica]
MSENSLDASIPDGVDRRTFLSLSGLGAAGVATAGAGPATLDRHPRRGLRFGRDGRFRIVQFNDTQDDEKIDRRTLELMRAVLDDERPDLVVLNGDNITGGCDTPLEMRQAMNNVVQPMEERGVPWAVTFGNHDEDSTPDSGVDEADMLAFYRSYRHNVNGPTAPGITGQGNSHLLIDGRGGKPAFNVWLLDSGRYAPETLGGQDFEGYPTWDWLRMDQVKWYHDTSVALERRYGRPIPSLMFIHIPLWEYRFMWFGSVDGRTDADHERGRVRHRIEGERNEDECPGPFNSGMFSAIRHRGDVRGVFCGHDHVNTYSGDYYGVLLGYAGNTGFGTYGLSGPERNRLRGARVYDLDESVDGVLAGTRMRFASEFGIDLTANDQWMEPLPLPRGK